MPLPILWSTVAVIAIVALYFVFVRKKEKAA